MKLWLKILVCILAIEVLGSLSGLLTASSIQGWFSTLERPPGNPPNWVFGPVWSVFYAMIGTSLALFWHQSSPGPERTKGFSVFGFQFLLNLAWTPVFFGAQQIALALVVIAMLAIGIVLTMMIFRPVTRVASLLLVPYLLWVSYATYLNAGFLYLNR